MAGRNFDKTPKKVIIIFGKVRSVELNFIAIRTLLNIHLMTNILLPIDFSPASRSAFQYALGLAPYLDARIKLLHVRPTGAPALAQAGPAPAPHVIDDDLELAEQFEALLQAPLSDSVSVETQLAVGQASEQILLQGAQGQADLIIMGSQGMHSSQYRLMGRETLRVVQHAPCPVLIIPQGASFRPFAHMSYASGAALAHQTAESMQELLSFAERFQAKVSCAHILPRPNQWYRMEFRYLEARFRRKLTSHLLGVYHFPEENLAQGMHKFMHETQVDLLALRIQHRSLFEWLFEHRPSRRLAAHTQVPVLMFRD